MTFLNPDAKVAEAAACFGESRDKRHGQNRPGLVL